MDRHRRTATELRPAIERAIDEEVAERVEAGEERASFPDVEVVNGNAYPSIKRIVRDIATEKHKQIADSSAAQQAAHAESLDRLVRLCIAATATGDRPHEGNPYTVAEALLTLARPAAATSSLWRTSNTRSRRSTPTSCSRRCHRQRVRSSS